MKQLSGLDRCLHNGADVNGCILPKLSVANRAFVSKHCLALLMALASVFPIAAAADENVAKQNA